MNKTTVSVPGRICLFGEHQDYLKLPVITAAIDLRVAISGIRSGHSTISIDLPDIKSSEEIPVLKQGQPYQYELERDYFRSVLNVMIRNGLSIPDGCECEVHGNIPINSGTSSSSALIVAWCRLLLDLYDQEKAFPFSDVEDIARLAYLSEVEEFGEPGGMMDHYATAIGGLLYQEFNKKVEVQKLNRDLGYFVLGDSKQAKDTKGILKRVKLGVLDAIQKINSVNELFDLKMFPAEQIDEVQKLISKDQKKVLEGALINRDITQQAKRMILSDKFDHREFGRLLSFHQEILDRKCDISTTKINRMLQKAIEAGAYGGKINGSGGGGCMFVYAPEDPQRVARAISESGGIPYVIKIDSGMRMEKNL